MFRTSPQGGILAASPALVRMLRYDSLEDLLGGETGTTPEVWATPQERARFTQSMESQGGVRDLECRCRCKDGAEIRVSLSARRIDGPDGQTLYFEGFGEDVTAREEQQAALREALQAIRDRERQLSTIFESVADALFLLTVEPGPRYRFVTVNRSFLRLTGLAAAQVVGQVVDEVIPEPSLSLVQVKYREAVTTGKVMRWEETTTYPAGVRCGEVQISPIHDAAGQCTFLAGVVHDVTESRRTALETEQLQEQLRRSQKLESLGRLAGGVAHDFNNLLTVINGYAAMLAEMGEDPGLRGYAQEIQKAGDKAAALTHQLLAFGRKQVIRPKPLDLNCVVREAERMLQRLIGDDIEFRTSYHPAPILVMADPAQLHEVIVNLAANARDSMPQGGRFEVTTSEVHIDGEGQGPRRYAPPGRYAVITVRDSGPGMTEEARRNIFEPFFTTKQSGKGVGMGLASVYGIVRQSGGWIEVESRLGHGTSFQIYLPRADNFAAPLEAEAALMGELHGSETVLVVEDNEGVRELTGRILRGYGYRVIETANGADALEAAKAYAGTIDLLLTDVVMPGMRGNELSQRIGELYPQMKVLLMSGYAESGLAHRGALDPKLAYIQKPFTSNALAARIRQLVG